VRLSSIMSEAVRSLHGAGRFAVILLAGLYLLVGPVSAAGDEHEHDHETEEVHDEHEGHEHEGEAHEEKDPDGHDHEGEAHDDDEAADDH